MELDARINQFRLASRELFNQYFRVEGASGATDVKFRTDAWAAEERHAEVEALLFQKLVLEPSQISGRYGERNSRIRVLIQSEFAPIMVNRASDSGYWDFPLKEVTNAVRMEFIRFFDWDQLAYRDNRYARVYIAEWPGQTEAVGKHALIESQYSRYSVA